jgi:hypothetical protein
MDSPGISAYIAQVDRLLSAGQELFPQGASGVAVFNSGGDRVPAPPAGASGLTFGAGGAAQDYRGTLAQATGLDDDVTATAGAAQATGQNGRAGATGERQTAQSAVAAIAPATGSPAGLKVLVSTMDDRLADMQRQIDTIMSMATATTSPRRCPAVRSSSSTGPVRSTATPPCVGCPTPVPTDPSAGLPRQAGCIPMPVSSLPRKPGMTARFTSSFRLRWVHSTHERGALWHCC